MGSGGNREMARRKLTAANFINVDRRVSPDDMRWLEIERDKRLADDRRSAAQVWLGEPEYSPSALAQYHRRQAERHSQPASGGTESKPSAFPARHARR